ncbi:hypothetical protein [Pseudoalteromonas luteoviolacea]|uniref:Uncharacterized protein n=1 Tax=Pseudoalteromonas luteoviolacea S4054 TaxID=1129367 RepID=A0A0F6A4L9_9GAMM|nr:hypothetical protein [Pseudoalteromonas luteoviolacea]AOT09358.1 hypothetical protein S4054249_16545 [Pseudoalteromonas luteoviolacea]AOT14270.1 hypothetical protein S40542_16515 [Pseudoalteromonas luteoviolacea]AOT19186.1 hypothetical protein S4054_16520 [Pseudoalteromonas luteoviolacea]KKE81142.1 hypothetical protein N479_23700 [Pseudoalteromonas luteoviolacea S4054]KZN73459.1 hypothetical protein N481_12115 [Pseudoalteromonas luteoviolacea S4047-1]
MSEISLFDYKDTGVNLVKAEQRSRIHYEVADADSLIGTTSDTTHLLLVEFAKLTQAISIAASLDEVKSAALQSASLFAPIVDKQNGEQLTFPYQHKGTESVLAEIAARAQGVADIIK